jgi:uncharacterized membrane protein YbhN (UPF0104 family)
VVVARAPAMTRRPIWGGFAVIALAAIAIVLGRHHLRPLETAARGWVAAALALNSVSMVLRAFAWLLILRAALPGTRIGAASVLRATMIGVMGSALAPGRVGEPTRVWLIARRLDGEGRVATVVGTVMSQTLVNLVALAILAMIALLGTGVPRWHAAGFALAALPVIAGVAVVIGARRAPEGRVARQLAALHCGLHVFRSWTRAPMIVGLQLAAWAFQALSAYALLFAVHLHVHAPLAVAAALLLAVNVTAAVPITPSNVGVFQAACLAILAAQGVGAGRGLAYGVLLQATEVVTAVALGVPAVLAEGVGFPTRLPADARAERV